MGQGWPRPPRAPAVAEAGSDPAFSQAPIVFSTADAEPVDQFEAYRGWMSSVADLWPTDPAAVHRGFGAAQTIRSFGALRLVRETCDPVEGRTAAARGRPSAVDHWVVALHKIGDTTVRSGDSVRRTTPGGICFAALTQAAHLRQDASETLYLFVPRDQLPDATASRWDRLHNLNLKGPCARLLSDHLLSLERNLGAIAPSALSDVAQATLDLLRVCLGTDSADHGRPEPEQALRRNALRAIRRNATAPMDPGRLCRLLGTSRSQLYRTFRNEGGVARVIRAERLAAARHALSDPGDHRLIYQIAESLGFRTAEEFSRAFRREFGCRPSDAYRCEISELNADSEATGLGLLL